MVIGILDVPVSGTHAGGGPTGRRASRPWIVDVDNAGIPIAAIRPTLDELPAHELPKAGTLLLQDLASPVRIESVDVAGAVRRGA